MGSFSITGTTQPLGTKARRRLGAPAALTSPPNAAALAPNNVREAVLQAYEAPPPGAQVSAGFAFDVPVRFASDRIDVSIAGWRSGELPSVPLVELRED